MKTTVAEQAYQRPVTPLLRQSLTVFQHWQRIRVRRCEEVIVRQVFTAMHQRSLAIASSFRGREFWARHLSRLPNLPALEPLT